MAIVLVSALAWGLLGGLLALELRAYAPAQRKQALGLAVVGGFGVGLLAGGAVALLLMAVGRW